jgi:hypothetical protein
MGRIGLFVVLCALAFPAGPAFGAQTGQIDVPRIESMPAFPKPYSMKDWAATACGFDKLAYDFGAKGEHLPLIRWDDSRININSRGFGLPAYVGPKSDAHQAITTLGSLLGATFVGIDKSAGEHNFVAMGRQYYNSKNGQNLVLNHVKTRAGGSFWYDVFPHIMFYTLADRYPKTERLDPIVKITAERWRTACLAMKGKDGKVDFNHTAFDFHNMKPVDNGKWTEPDAAAGIGWLQYMAWLKFGDPKHLRAAELCMTYLHERKTNPYYEVQLPFGAYTAARMNAERGAGYDLKKLIDWCFEQSSVVRPDMGVISANWAGEDCHGLVGAINRRPRKAGGGYAFAMNTYATAWPMVPMVRYDDRYARAIGKWMLNAANAARLFYRDAHPAKRQTCPDWKGDPGGVIAYEGLRHHWHRNETFIAGGDPLTNNWAYKTDFGVYGSALSGVFGGIVRTTNVKYILQLDCLATDTLAGKAYPTYLYFNPYKESKSVKIRVGAKRVDLYDAAANKFVKRNVSGEVAIDLAPDSAALIVIAPAGGKLTRQGAKTLIDGVIIDYRSGAAPVSVIFDTDMDTDCDDTGALAMLHAMADSGEVNILATTVSSRFAYSAPCVEAINRYYRRPGIPIGVPKGAGAPTKRGSKYARQIAEAYKTRLKTNKDADDAVDVYRRVLASQEDGSVVIVTVGYMTNLRDLLGSKPDKHSKLTGAKLVKAKVKRWVCMGGKYPARTRHGGYGNFMPDPGATVHAAANWPGEICFSGLGGKVLTGRTLVKTPAGNPVRRAYKLYLRDRPARPSWDQVALLFAVRPNAAYWKLRRKGSNHIYPNGTNRWVDKPDLERHVLVEFAGDSDARSTVTQTIEKLMSTPPRKTDR